MEPTFDNERYRRREIHPRHCRESAASDGSDSLGSLQGIDLAMDRALEALYDSDRKGGLGSSCPNVARWLGDIRQYFPSSVLLHHLNDGRGTILANDRLDLK